MFFPAYGKDYDVRKFGAMNDTTRLSTHAINRAIESCAENGGGRVIIPSGNYKSGTIILRNNVELYLEKGATLYASTQHKDFPRQEQPLYRSQKDPGGWYALIYAENAENIGISGEGTIDGNGAGQMSRPECLGGDRDGRPRNILLISCKKIKVEGLSMRNAGIWNQHYLNCEDLFISKLQVYNHSNRNNDGLDIDGCRRVSVADCVIDSDDDGIVLKSTGSAGCEDVSITNCIISSYTNAIKIGTETTGRFNNIHVSDCTVRPSRSTTPSIFGFTNMGITAISLEMVDGGILENVNINNIVIEGTLCPIYIRLANRARKHYEEAPEPPLGQMRNIVISDITAYNTGNYSSSITGIAKSKIENVVLKNIRQVNRGRILAGDYINSYKLVKEEEKSYPEPTVWGNLPSYGFFVKHVKNILFQNISLKSEYPDPRFPFIACYVDNLTIDGLKVDNIDDKPMIQLINVKKQHINSNIRIVKNEEQ